MADVSLLQRPVAETDHLVHIKQRQFPVLGYCCFVSPGQDERNCQFLASEGMLLNKFLYHLLVVGIHLCVVARCASLRLFTLSLSVGLGLAVVVLEKLQLETHLI